MKPKKDLFYAMSHGVNRATLKEGVEDERINFLDKLGKKIPIIGAGGVEDGYTALEKIKSGASLCQLYTAMIYKGPFVAQNINKELSHLLSKEGFNSIQEAIGYYC